MQVGDLVQDRRLNVGVITKKRRAHPKHWWVLWLNGDSHTIHERFLEVIC